MSLVAGNALLSDPSVRDAVAACREITRHRAANFYWGLRLTPEPKRSAMYSIYAWMREADDLVDGRGSAGPGDSMTIEAFRAATVEALAGETRSVDPIWRSLSAVAREYPLDPCDFHSMIDGQLADLQPRQLANWCELECYCRQVASTVGSICVRIWGYDDPRAIELAIDRGIAFQLTNILRDVVEDVGLGRVYLPYDELESRGITAADLCGWTKPRECDRFMRSMIDRAREFFARSQSLDGMIDSSCRPTLWALTEIYRELLERIARDPSQISRKRVSLPTLRKVLIAFRARGMGRKS